MSTCSFDYEHHMRATALSDEGVNKNLVYDKFSERIYFESRLFNNINDERIELDKVTKSLNRELREQIKKLGFSDEMYKTVVVPNSGLFDKNSVYIEYSPEKHEREIIDAWANEDANFKVVIKTLSQVKKDLSLKNEVTERQKAFLLARLRDYNIKNRTKHSIEFDKVGYSELERTTLKLNFNEKDAIKPRTVITNSKIRIDNRSPEEVRRDKKRFINEDARQAQREDAERAGIEYTDRYLFDQRSRNSEELNEFYRSVIRKVQEKLSVLYPEINVFDESFISDKSNRIIGQANIKAMTVMFDPQFEKKDGETRYHEYAHHYIAWFRNHPLVQEAINKWGSEEALVQSIGEQSVKQKGEAWTWWQNFFKFLQDLLKKLSSKDKNELRNILTDAFLSRIDLDSGTKLSTERIKQLAQEATEGMFNQEIDNMIEKGFIVKKFQELQENGNLATISQSKIDNLQSTIEYQLLNEKDEDLDKKTGQYYIFLSEIDAQRFTYLIEKNKEFPKEFKVTAKITKYEKDPKDPFKFYASNEYVDYYYIKSNKNKKSNLYDLVRKETGEVIASKVRVLSVSKDAKSEIAEKYGLEHTATKIFSANRSIAFALYRQKPSKAKYIAQAKKYLYDAIKFLNPKETNLKINLDKIEDLLNSFPEEMWDYINTTYSPEDSTNINASISLQNEIKFKLPKLGFLQEIEKITGISLQGVSFKNYDRSGSLAKVFRYSKLNGEWGDTITIDNSMTTKELKASIRYYLSTKKIFKPTSEEENVRKYAEHRGIDYNKLRELVFGDIEKALDNIAYNNTGNSDTMELSKWRESIRNYDWQSIELFNKPYENFQNTVKERIIAKFKDKNLSNGISHLEYFFSSGAFNWLNINFNNISGQYYMADMETEANVGVETKMGGIINPFEMKIYQKPKAGENFLQEKEVFNRLAAILHEPFHALHALSYGTKEELELRKAFDNLYRTDFGKEMINQVFGSGYNKGQQVSYDTLYKEFTAFTTQIMLYPKQWIKDTDLRSNDIYEFIEKIETLQDKTYEEIVKTKQKIGTTEKVVTEEEKIKLTFLEKLYNYLVKALNKIIPLSKKFTNLIADSKLVEKKVIEDVFGETEEVVIKTLKLPENVKKFKEDFSQAMNELQSAINTLMQIDGKLFSSENITNFFTSNKFNQEINYNFTQKQQALQKKHLKTENIIDNNKEIDFQLDLENLNLTNDVLMFLHENSTKTKDFSTFAKVVKKMIAIWENSGLSTEEITEMIKCL